MSHLDPPKILVTFLLWFCPEQLQESILGDLEEQHEEDVQLFGKARADRRFAWNVIRFVRPGILLRRKLKTQFNNMAMIKNYLKIAYRNILRYKFFSFFNVLGLSIGMCMSLFILTHIFSELSYETSFPRYQSIYRFASTNWAKMAPKLSLQLKEEMPEINTIGRLYYMYPKVMVHEETQVMIDKPFFADETILNIFSLEFLEGIPEGALDDHYDIVITESMAERMFKPDEPRVGGIIQFFGEEKYTVTGVIKDLPANSHLKIDCLVSIEKTWVSGNTSTSWSAVGIYALFDSEDAVGKVQEKLLDFQVRFGGSTEEEVVEGGDFLEVHPITDIHLNSHREKEMEANSDMTLIYIFSTLVVFILLVVIINFINLYVSQTLNRLKEIGIRKVMGAQRIQLTFQFLAESFLLVFISAIVALGLAYFAVPFYNQLSSVKLEFSDLLSTEGIVLLVGLVLLVGFLAGGYPALYLSGFGIDQGLKTKQIRVNRRFSLRTIMVACQFLISVSLLTATLIVSQQMNFIQDKDLGFADEEVVAIKLHGKLWWETVNSTDKVRNELLKNADVKHVSISSKTIGERFGIENIAVTDDPENGIHARYVRADEHFLQTLGLTVNEGDFESRKFDGFQYVLNKAAALAMQKEDLIGKTLVNGPESEGKLVAIVDDFHFTSLHNQIEPLVIQMMEDKRRFADFLLIRIATGDYKNTMLKIEATLQEIAPGSLIASHFLNDKVEQLYRSENSLFSSFKIFSSTIILLACLGLFALFSFISQTRKKELGIRKTLGASLTELLMTMSKSYLGILIVTTLLAIPITWYFSSEWLANFAYQTTVEWWYFVVPGLFILFLAAVAMVSQSWKVANSNPVESLRDD